jgi:hypothetical protein
MSLLERVKKTKFKGDTVKLKVTESHVDIAIAYLNKEVAFQQIMTGLFDNKRSSYAVYAIILKALIYGVEKGIIKIKKVK